MVPLILKFGQKGAMGKMPNSHNNIAYPIASDCCIVIAIE
ncbi:MAG: hypothetical protein RIR17_1801 [Planctomycetota bacterium]|jgi:hypothetical protein